MKRSSGVLLPIFSLPSKYGVGTLGKEAYNIVDFLSETKQSYWQMLPIMTTNFGNSPYSAVSCFAGNPFFIDYDLLRDDGVLNKEDYEYLDNDINPRRVDYKKQFEHKFKILKKACNNFQHIYKKELQNFYDKYSYFLDNYAIFCAIKDKFNGISFDKWPNEYKLRDDKSIKIFIDENKDIINYYKTIQCIFYRQWFKLKAYANKKGIQIIGDFPINGAYDSAEVWSNPKNFYLNNDLMPIEVSGCPPDNFFTKGQLWGNPLYNYDYIKKNNYEFFINIFSHLLTLYDVLRIDHFRAFEAYYSIPFGDTDALHGRWVKAPGKELFDKVKETLGDINIIVEDLGFLTDDTRKLLKSIGFPGMKVMEYGFNANDKNCTENLPHTYPENCVAYLGTHDNDTFMGWINSISNEDREYAIEYLNLKDPANYYKEALEVLYNTKANLVIVQFQDLLGTYSIGRMNIPATLSDMNWSYRMLPNELDNNVKLFLKSLTTKTNRNN